MITWSPSKIKAFQKALLTWYDTDGRYLPWRRDHDPYHVWVSEIMLQQTQVNTVIPYYNRFMDWFPTVTDLADAPEERLMKAWEGLGYYSRARNLQKAAKQVVEDFNGKWPRTAEGLLDLAGIGPYTAGAIASIAFGEPVPAVDGNAFRVFSRLLEIDDDIAKPQTRQVFEQVIGTIIPTDRPGDFNQAIMDLGSSYMTAKNPDSENSPVKAFDQAYLDGVEDQYPVKTKKPRPVPIPYFGLVIHADDRYLMEKRPSTGLLANFWTFPLVKRETLLTGLEHPETVTDEKLVTLLEHEVAETDGLKLHLTPRSGKQVTHTFTHQKWLITLMDAEWSGNLDLSYFPGEWLTAADFERLALPKVQDKMWQRVRPK